MGGEGGRGRGLCVSKYMMGVWEWEESKDNGTKLCLVTAKSSGHQLKYRIDFFFFNYYFIVRMVKHWNKFSRAVTETPPLEMIKI